MEKPLYEPLSMGIYSLGSGHKELFEYAREIGIDIFLLSQFGIRSANRNFSLETKF